MMVFVKQKEEIDKQRSEGRRIKVAKKQAQMQKYPRQKHQKYPGGLMDERKEMIYKLNNGAKNTAHNSCYRTVEVKNKIFYNKKSSTVLQTLSCCNRVSKKISGDLIWVT